MYDYTNFVKMLAGRVYMKSYMKLVPAACPTSPDLSSRDRGEGGVDGGHDPGSSASKSSRGPNPWGHREIESHSMCRVSCRVGSSRCNANM
jgi:hypothetical protein